MSARAQVIGEVEIQKATPRRLVEHYPVVQALASNGADEALGKDSPVSRPVQPPELGAILELPEVGGLHHRYERQTA